MTHSVIFEKQIYENSFTVTVTVTASLWPTERINKRFALPGFAEDYLIERVLKFGSMWFYFSKKDFILFLRLL